MSTKTIGEKLREIRVSKKLPLRKVAGLLDIDVAILSKMERGERPLSKEIVKKLAKIYNYDEEELLVAFFSEKIILEVGEEDLAFKALKAAEDQIEYLTYKKLDKTNFVLKIKNYFKTNKKISKVWIFGSFARGEDDYKSDIDVMIRVPQNSTFSLFDIAEIQHELELIIPKKIDVVMEDGVKKEIMERIKPDLKLIYEK